MNNTKNTEAEKLSLRERLYFPEIFRGLSETIKEIFRPKFTRQYPEERWEPEGSYRGRPVLVQEENGTGRCVACGLCSRMCPAMAIYVEAEEVELENERRPKVFEIDMLRCIFCGNCEEVCPEEAIVMSKDYDIVFLNREDAIFGKEQLAMPKEQLKDRLDFLKEYR